MSALRAPFVAELLRATSRRVTLIRTIGAITVALTGAALVMALGLLAGWSGSNLATTAALTALFAFTLTAFRPGRSIRSLTRAAQAVEERAPQARNVVRTAAELLEDRVQTSSYVQDEVLARADRMAATLSATRLFPMRRSLARLLVASLAAALTAWLHINSAPVASTVAALITGAPAVHSVTATLTPPPYSGLPTTTVRDPEMIRLLAGTRVDLEVSASTPAVQIQTVEDEVILSRGPGAELRHTLLVDSDGFITVHPVQQDGSRGAPRTIGVRATPDLLPRVSIVAPGRDLFLPDGNTTLTVQVDARDDLALDALRLTYTRVSGSGEQFTFEDGEIPLNITRGSQSEWSAMASWDLRSLALQPGDMVVYRGVAQDRRPGAPPAESDTYIVEMAGPGALMAGGFSIDDEHDRYAVSQQMVIVKTERLMSLLDSLPPVRVAEEAALIAIEQRRVRAEFVFMMGGDLADEVEHEHSGVGDLNEHTHAVLDDEAVSGRLAHQGRTELIRAIRSMSQANALLVAAEVPAALEAERAALAALQRAFARTRYILRTLTEREQLDMSRRLTGSLSAAVRDVRPAVEAPPDSLSAAVRGILADVAFAAGGGNGAAPDIGELAGRLLKLADGDSTLLQASLHISRAAEAGGRGPESRRNELQSAIDILAAHLRRSDPLQLPGEIRTPLWRLDDALGRALRGAGGGS